jgi:hypothetical protein
MEKAFTGGDIFIIPAGIPRKLTLVTLILSYD